MKKTTKLKIRRSNENRRTSEEHYQRLLPIYKEKMESKNSSSPTIGTIKKITKDVLVLQFLHNDSVRLHTIIGMANDVNPTFKTHLVEGGYVKFYFKQVIPTENNPGKILAHYIQPIVNKSIKKLSDAIENIQDNSFYTLPLDSFVEQLKLCHAQEEIVIEDKKSEKIYKLLSEKILPEGHVIRGIIKNSVLIWQDMSLAD